MDQTTFKVTVTAQTVTARGTQGFYAHRNINFGGNSTDAM